jgi:branched-chain amino acid transport system substrate-binding protein
VRILIFAAMIAVLGAGTVAAADQPPFEIDAIVSLTGPAAFIGQSDKSALSAAETAANRTGGIRGRPVRFVFFDDQTNAQVAVQLANQLIAKKVSVILGPAFTATCRAVAPLLETAGPVDYCLSPGIEPAKDSYVYSAGPSVHEFGLIMYRYARLRGWKRFSAIFPTDASGQIGETTSNEILKLPEFKDVTMVASEHFNTTDLEVSAQIARIKAAGPQMIFAWPSGTSFGTVLRGIAQVGLDVPVIGTSANLNADQLKLYAAFYPKELSFEAAPYVVDATATPAMKRRQQVLDETMKAVAARVDAASGTVFDVGSMVVDALRKFGPDASADQIRQYISGLTGYSGSAGVFDFKRTPQRGLTVNDLVMVRYDPEKGTFFQVSRLGGEPLR